MRILLILLKKLFLFQFMGFILLKNFIILFYYFHKNKKYYYKILSIPIKEKRVQGKKSLPSQPELG